MTVSTTGPGLWSKLAGTGAVQRGEFRVVNTGVKVGTGDVLFAVDASGCRHILIQTLSNVPFASDRRSGGVQIVLTPLLDGSEIVDYIDVACRKVHLNELFAVVADEMLAAVSLEPAQPAAACRRVLARWRELLDREPSTRLTDEELLGLFGELWHLREILRRNTEALSVWRGPFGDPHDFHNADTALEVKSTLRREGLTCEIHGAEQLEPPPGGALFLALLRLSLDDSGELVPDLIYELRAMGVDGAELLSCLARIGYDSRDEAYYRERHFRIIEHRVFEVDLDFPKIVASSFAGGAVPARVMSLRYLVDLAGYPDLNVHDVEELFDRLSGGSE